MKKKSFWTKGKLIALGVPPVLAVGMLAAINLGWVPDRSFQEQNYYQNETVFPKSAVVDSVIDGDTLTLVNGQSVRLIGINAPERGKENFDQAKDKLNKLATGEKVYLEYDRTQDDQFGRIMAWAWVHCESEPEFLPPDYMRLSYNKSRPGLTENPEGCKEGELLNEAMVKAGLAETLNYKGRGELKYEERLTE
ncbi:thermonuclease family protein [Patescibacteria group bacterium]|nr:thermonuclease family protein [Patescibacteria group bacterium]